LKRDLQYLGLLLGSKWSEELELFLVGLEASMTLLGGGIDEFDVDGFQVSAVGMLHQRLAENQWSLLNSNYSTLQHDPILIDFTIMDETSHWGDALLGKIGSGLARSLVSLLSDSVHLLVEFGTVEVTILTGTWDCGRHTSRVPRSNTGNLTETTVGLTWETGDTPTGSDTLESLTFGDSNNIDLFVLCEDRINSDLLLEEIFGKVDLGFRVGSSVDLDFHNVSLLDAEVEFLNLCVGDDADDGAELGNSVKLGINILSSIGLVLGDVLGVGLFLCLVPILVHATLKFIAQVLSKDSRQGAESTWCFDVSYNTDNNHRRGLKDGDGIDNFLLVHDGTGTINTTDNVGHTGFVSTEGGQVRLSIGGVTWETANATGMVLGTLLWEESQVTTARSFEFTVGL